MSKDDDVMQFQMINGDQLMGLHKGTVVDNRDTTGKGRVRIWSYGLHGDFTQIPVKALPWAEPMIPISGSFTPPPMWSRVLFGFETGSRYHPIYVGFWYGVPNGAGKLPFDSGTGTEVRPEAWHFHDLSPEVIMLACSGEGNAVWMEQKFLGQNDLASSINLMDTGGKSVSIQSIHLDTGNFESTYINADISTNTLNSDTSLQPGLATRTGTDTPDQVTGFIDIAHQNVYRSLISDADTFTEDLVVQNDKDGNLTTEQHLINGDIVTRRSADAHESTEGSVIFTTAPMGVFINQLLITPRRYDL